MAVPLFSIKSDQQITGLVRDGIDTMIQELGKPCKIVMEGVAAACPNCVYDGGLQKSSGAYNGTGPKPFSRPPCPVCKGSGVDPTTAEETAIRTFGIRRDVKPNEVVVPPSATVPTTIARIKGFVEDIPLLLRMKYIILDYENAAYMGERYAKLSDPSPSGNLVAGRWFIMHLRKIQ